MAKLTSLEMRQIKAVEKHMAYVDYGSFSATAIHNLLCIIDRLTNEKNVNADKT